MKKVLVSCFLSLASFVPFANARNAKQAHNHPFVGYYQTIDDEINKPKSIVALYSYAVAEDDGDAEWKLGGRIIALYNVETGKISETLFEPKRVADKVEGSPKMAGLDIIWNMEWDEDDAEYEDGRILDPKTGKVYKSVIWQEKDEPTKLRVRGKIGPFGRTQVWNVLKASDLPKELQKLDTTGWAPKTKEK
ncbi:MAG: DUF2147 domain-containing protein [Rickettsiales bacterium]|jgi:uncharacterized protein (DUF2147 family)|nr:DUF2147 domain-containing protein [Rickettsiales bacterium]